MANVSSETAGSNSSKKQNNGAVKNADDHKIFNKEELQHLASEKGEEVKKFLQEKSQQVKESKDIVEEKLKKYPFTSVAIAFVGGAILSALLRRK